MDRLKVIYLPMGGNPFEVEIDCKLEDFQRLVGGYFDYVMADANNAMVYNADAEGQINFTYKGMKVCGDVFFVGYPSGRKVWTDTTLTVADINRLIERGKV